MKKISLKDRLQKYLDADARLAKLSLAVKKEFDKSGLTAHNWEHIYRDTLNAVEVGEAEKANMGIVLPAIIMHDIGFLYGAPSKVHGPVGAKKLPVFLKKIKIKFSATEIDQIAECIRTHKGSMHREKPITLEAKVVADADLIEKFGPIGVYQYIRTFTEFNRGIDLVIGRKDQIKWLSLETKTGKKIAEKGRKFVKDYFDNLGKAYKNYL